MGYKVNYNEMWELIDIIQNNGGKWNGQLNNFAEKYKEFNNPNLFKGEGATSINTYLNEVHGTIISKLGTLIENLIKGSNCYRYGYQDQIDGGDGSKTGVLHTTIVQDEVEDGGLAPRNVLSMIELNSYIKEEADRAIRNVLDIVDLSNLIYPDRIENALATAKGIAIALNVSVLNYEANEKNNLTPVKDVIEELQKLIGSQLGRQRVPIASYRSGGIYSMCDYDKLCFASQNVETQNITMTEYYEKSVQFAFNRNELIKQEREDEVKWIRWVVTGVCVIATVAVTIACPAAGLATLAIVGSVTGTVSGVTNEVLDQYVETGFEDGIDWSKLGKAAFVGGVAGAVTSVVAGGGGIGRGVSKIGQSLGQKIGTEIGNNLIGSAAETGASLIFDMGEKVITGKTDEIDDCLIENGKEFGKAAITDVIGGVVGPVLDDKIGGKLGLDDKLFKKWDEGLKKDIGKAAFDTAEDVVFGAVENTATAFAEETYDHVVSGEEFKLKDIGESIVDGAVNDTINKTVTNAGNVYIENKVETDKSYRDQKFEGDIKKKYGNKEFKVVEFENGISVLKSDYDAAMKVTSEKGYDGKSARELLGLRSIKGETTVHTVDRNDIKNVTYPTKSDILRFKIKE